MLLSIRSRVTDVSSMLITRFGKSISAYSTSRMEIGRKAPVVHDTFSELSSLYLLVSVIWPKKTSFPGMLCPKLYFQQEITIWQSLNIRSGKIEFPSCRSACHSHCLKAGGWKSSWWAPYFKIQPSSQLYKIDRTDLLCLQLIQLNANNSILQNKLGWAWLQFNSLLIYSSPTTQSFNKRHSETLILEINEDRQGVKGMKNMHSTLRIKQWDELNNLCAINVHWRLCRTTEAYHNSGGGLNRLIRIPKKHGCGRTCLRVLKFLDKVTNWRDTIIFCIKMEWTKFNETIYIQKKS